MTDTRQSIPLIFDDDGSQDGMTASVRTTVSLTPETLIATEGETFAWNFSLDTPAPAGGLSLFLPITVNNDPAPGDVEYNIDGSSNISEFEFVLDESISQIYAFGDSYSEDGLSLEISTNAVNAGVPDSFILPADLELGLYDTEGRWTNGLTAVEALSQNLGVELTDYAVGGAKSGNGNYYSWLDSFQDTGVFGQIDQFKSESGQTADPDGLYFIFASANDFVEYADFGLSGTVEELANQTVDNIVDSVTELSELGAEKFLVVNSSDLDILPGVIEFGQAEQAELFVDEVNSLLPQELASLDEELDVDIALYDHVAISDEIRSNPEEYGLTNVDDPCQPVFPVEPACEAPDEHYFWDEYHPTRRAHEIIGEDMASFVEGEFNNDVSIGFNITIAEGATEATLVSEAVADDVTETDETFTTVIADGVDYVANPEQNSVTTTITELPVVTLTTDEVNVAEGDTFAWNFSLNRPAPEGGLTLSLPITLNNDPEPGDVIYNVEGSTNIEDFGFIIENDVSIGFTLTIPEGETEATLVSQAVVDDVAEFDEIFTTVLADGNDYVANPVSNQVVTTIVEDGEAPPSSAPVVSITPGTVISTEGDTFAWDFTLDRPVPEGGLTLNLPITQNNDPAPGDVIYNVDGSIGITDFDFIVEDDISIGFSVTLEEGVTSATLVSEAVADDNDLDDSADEIFTTVLADGVDYRVNPDSNEVVTVLTREPVVTLTPEQVNVTEGDTFAWNFSLNQPAPEGGLTLSLPITFNNDPEPGDVIYNVEGSTGITDFSFLVVDNVSLGFDVTIAEGATEATLVSQAVADDLAEIDEIFTTVLADGGNYRANPLSKEVVTTIFEQDSSSTPVVSVFAQPTEVEEGSQLLWNFSLTEAASEGGLTVTLDLVEDTDPLPGDITYFVDGSENVTDFELVIDEESGLIEQALVTLAEGATEATLVNDIIADNVTEGEESVSFALAQSDEYGIDSDVNAASFTILDTSTEVMDIIDLTSFTVEVSATANAGFTNIGGFYQAVDTEGTVIDPTTGESVSPGDAGYEDAALANSVVQIGDGEDATLELDGGFAYIPYLLANGTRFFTAFEEANADGLDHVESAGDNTFGFEDLLGGGDNDFNDYVISFDIV